MRRFIIALASSAVLSFGFVAITARDARADEPTVQPKPEGEAPLTKPEGEAPLTKPEGEAPLAKPDDDSDLKRISLEVNPLALTIGRYSISGEYLVARHHAITLNPFYSHTSITLSANGQDVDLGSLSGFGGELGYRFYTGSKGPNGFFVGPSVLFASYSSSTQVNATATKTEQSFTSVGGAIDIGGQAVIGPGIVIGGGFGLQYTKNSEEISTDNLNISSAIVAGGGVRPRFLLALGYAF